MGMNDGYAEADKLDRQINKLLEDCAVTPANSIEWLKFARTVKTSAALIEEVAKAALRTKLTLKRDIAIKLNHP